MLVDYLRQIVAPRLSGLGVIHDDYPVSTSLLDPAGTLFSLVLLIALIVLAVKLRRRYPLVSLGVFWFFAGHSLEAGPIPLELYFEHRNYLPLLGPLIAICSLLPMLSRKLRRGLPLLLLLFVGMQSFFTWQAASAWSSEDLLMRTALAEHPDSLRARQHQANRHIVAGRYADALAVQNDLARKFPEHTSSRMSILNLRCVLDVLTAEQVEATIGFLEQSRHDLQIVGFLAPLAANAANVTCAALGFAELHAVFDALLRNPSTAGNDTLRGAVLYHKGLAFETSGDLDEALEQLNLSYAAKPDIDIRLLQAVWLLGVNRAKEARRYLELAERHSDERFLARNFRRQDLAALRHRIDQAIAAER